MATSAQLEGTSRPQPRACERRWSFVRLVTLWNWKSAVLSVMLRAPVFAIVTLRHGPEVVAGTVLTETVVCAVNAGWFAAIAQVLRNRKPVWLVATVISVIVPACGQVIEYVVHLWHQTPHRLAAVIISTLLGGIAQLFNWYAMKHGSLLVGGERSSFAADLRRFPVLFARFLWLGPQWLARRLATENPEDCF